MKNHSRVEEVALIARPKCGVRASRKGFGCLLDTRMVSQSVQWNLSKPAVLVKLWLLNFLLFVYMTQNPNLIYMKSSKHLCRCTQKLKALQIQNPNSGQFVHGGPFKKNIASRNSFAVQPHNRINRKERNDQSHEISSRFWCAQSKSPP